MKVQKKCIHILVFSIRAWQLEASRSVAEWPITSCSAVTRLLWFDLITTLRTGAIVIILNIIYIYILVQSTYRYIYTYIYTYIYIYIYIYIYTRVYIQSEAVAPHLAICELGEASGGYGEVSVTWTLAPQGLNGGWPAMMRMNRLIHIYL